jgi:2-amino-4-hydroxy-6-hydroxymethyldihydropteridine diphosphokinase
MIAIESDPIVLALGCNLGPRRETLEAACRALERSGVRVVRRSRLYCSRPWGFAEQPDFLNAAVQVRTALRPRELLARCLWLESEFGRARGATRWGPRRIDLDLLMYGAVRGDEPLFTLPHLRIAQRDFVLWPLIDLGVAPRHPEFRAGWPALLAALPPRERTVYHSQPWRWTR